MNKKAIIAMSGGVDSSVAALLTKQMGLECIGATMKLFDNDDVGKKKENSCCSLEDVEEAEAEAALEQELEAEEEAAEKAAEEMRIVRDQELQNYTKVAEKVERAWFFRILTIRS